MILLSSVIETFKPAFLEQYQGSIVPSHLHALDAMENCRTTGSPLMLAECIECEHKTFVPHSCGHRNCPHCQHHESQQWLERQLEKRLPAEYFMVTFTLPAEFRPLAWKNQRALYSLLFQCAWETVRTFAENDKRLQGLTGATAVLHTHSRDLESYHPHIHLVMPAAAIDEKTKQWRTKEGYLFNELALAKVFRAKMLKAITNEGLALPNRHPEKWVVHCKSVGTGDKALVYLGRYLYRGVIREKDILSCENGQVTFRYQDSKTKRMVQKTIPGVTFLWWLLRNVLPRGFRRARNFGFLHSNCKLLGVIHYLIGLSLNRPVVRSKQRPTLKCSVCGSRMRVVMTRIPPFFPRHSPVPVKNDSTEAPVM